MAALDGLKILDLTQYEAGTSCTQALAWLGADVLKLESPVHGDPGRSAGFRGTMGTRPTSGAWNANKKSVAVDLKSERGRGLFMDLLPGCDFVVENYAPGVLERLGLGYEVLKAAHPGVILGQIKGFGNSGPIPLSRAMTPPPRRPRACFPRPAKGMGLPFTREPPLAIRARAFKWPWRCWRPMFSGCARVRGSVWKYPCTKP